MANKDDHLTYYREFFENFAQTVNPNDQLPVKLASYKLVNYEVVGGIIDWTTQYLSQKKCPPNLFAPLIKIVIEEIRKACKKQPVNCGFNPADNAYEPLKLMQTVMAKTNEVCLRYLDNSMLCSLPSPDTGTPYCITSVCAVKNTRRRMEDRHVVIHDLNTMFNIQEASPSSYYAVFDGHAGHDAAAYSSAHLHQFLAENKYFASNPKQALLDAFCKTDVLFIDKCKVENLNSGTTAVVALLRPKEKVLYVAWVGDSQALIVNKGRALQIVNPHKPCRPDERERIEKRGGVVLLWGTWRVNGQLAVSRAIGDPEYKPFVIAVPDIQEIKTDGADFVVLACDGLWDILSEEAVARAVYSLVTENPDDTDRISQRLVHLAKEQGSTDNISVIVVFLREPSKIAAEAHWANRNLDPATMEAGLDNTNNPFGMPNGANTDNIITQKTTDGLLLNLTDNYKQNGTELQPSDFFSTEKSNGKRLSSDFDDEDFGPETDIDALDDVLSPGPKDSITKSFADAFSPSSPNNNLLTDEGVFNPFMEHQEKAALELEKNLRKRENREEFEEEEEEEERMAREETPTPPADAVHDVSGLVENPADSESEDEWNYFKGDEANKENISPQPEKEVADIPEEDDTMSQLNPNAAEFVPVSPTRSVPSPTCRMLINDQIVSQSPKKANDLDLNVPNPNDFEKEVRSRPSELFDTNGHDEESDLDKSRDLMENILNGKNIDEIPEFQPGSTPKKTFPSDEFHFGPNAAPFTPKLLDQSEAISTKAVYGDESVATVETTFNESINQDLLNKESDPMSASFYADKGESNPFDLNTVHVLPDNLDEFLSKPDNETFNETISDLPEHNPLSGEQKNNDAALQITDLDKHSYDDEKELASPLETEKELLTREETDFAKTPEPTHENLLGDEFCCTPKTGEWTKMPADVEVISPIPTATEVSDLLDNISVEPSKVPFDGKATEVDDLLKSGPESMPPDVELLPDEIPLTNKPSDHEMLPIDDSSVNEVLAEPTEIVQPKLDEFARLESPINELSSSPSPVKERLFMTSPEQEKLHAELHQKIDSPIPDLLPSESEAKAVCEEALEEVKSAVCDKLEPELLPAESFGGLAEAVSPVCDKPVDFLSSIPLPTEEEVKAVTPELGKSEKIDLSATPEPTPEHFKLDYPEPNAPVCDLSESKSPIPEAPLSPDFTKQEQIEEAEARFEELCKPIESPQEDVTSSIKDDLSSPIQDLLSKSPLADQVIDDSFTKEQVIDDSFVKQEIVEVHASKEGESVPPSDIIASVDQTPPAEAELPEFIDIVKPPLKSCICPSRLIKEVELPLDVKTETISPEYAEPAIVTPSEESKADDLPAPAPEEPAKEPLGEEEKVANELKNEMTAVGVASAVATGAAIAAVAATTKVEEKKKSPIISTGKKPDKPTPSKTPTTTKSPLSARTTQKLPNSASKPNTTTTRTTTPLKAATPKTATPRPSASSTSAPKASPRPSLSKPNLTKPKPTATSTSRTSTTRSTEKGPLTNGEIKSTIRSTLTMKKPSTDATAAKTATSRPSTGTASSRITQSRVSTRPSTTSAASKTTIPPRSTTLSNRIASSAAAKRPTTLSSGNSSPDKTTASKPTLSKTSPKSTPNVLPKTKPFTTSTSVSKPRVPLTKTVAKAPPDTEKQIKESANKITASRSVYSTTRPAGAVTARNTVTRGIESKVNSTRTTVTKTTTTTMKSTTAKKPVEVLKGTAIKTKTTKVEKPKENGITTVVTEEITVVNNAVVNNTTPEVINDDSQQELIKDNSPVDNKLLIETTQLVDTNAD